MPGNTDLLTMGSDKSRTKLSEMESANEELRVRIEELTDFIENASIPLHWVNGNGIIIWANQAELNLLGYTKEEYLHKHISNFHADQQVIEDILTRLMKKETLKNYPARLRCKSGNIKDVLINSNVYWKDGEFIHTRCFTMDITELKSENDKLKRRTSEKEKTKKNAIIAESSILNKMILEVKDYAILLLGKDGTVLSWNQGAERIKGYAEKEIVGQNFTIFYLPEDRQSKLPEKLLAEATLNGRASHEGLRVRKNGTTFFGSIVITALHDENNNVVGFTKVTSDLSERKNLLKILKAHGSL